MKIPIKIKSNQFFRVLLDVIDKFPPIKGLMKREMDVLAELMYQNYLNKDITDFNRRQIFIFSKENRGTMRDRLEMSEGSFNDYLCRLRRKHVVTKDNKLMQFLNIIPDGKYEFKINFDIND